MQADQPSSTARLVVAGLLYARTDQQLKAAINQQQSDLLQEFPGHFKDSFWQIAQSSWIKPLVRLTEHLICPGIFAHWAARKQIIYQKVLDLREQGYQQIVILAGGLDSLGLQLSRNFPELKIFEFDHPATQNYKKLVYAGALEQCNNYTLLPLDLSQQSAKAALFSCRQVDFNQPVLLLMEGLLMYFKPESVTEIFKELAATGFKDLKVLFTFMTPNQEGGASFDYQHSLLSSWLKFMQEPFKWGIKAEQLKDWLAKVNFTSIEVISSQSIAASINWPGGQSKPPYAHGEHLCLAELGPFCL